jgi:NAD(P)-dependent dehydrogenase (short-subunit alcohol dehydrogenase family)
MPDDSKPHAKQPHQPGSQRQMSPQPEVIAKTYRGAGKLDGKVAIVTGGDSGIGRSVAVHFAREGADVAILYLDEHEDARDTLRMIEAEGRRGLAIAGDVGGRAFCDRAVAEVRAKFGRLDVLVNNAAEQHLVSDFEKITEEQLVRTFRTNLFGYFHMAQAALPHLGDGAAIINTTSVTAYRGNPGLIDYSATKGAIVSFTRSLSKALAERGIRVNGVAPGPICTPLIPATFPAEKVDKHGEQVPLGRAGQPSEVAPCYVFLAAGDSSYMSGQVLHPNGGEVVNG